LKSNLKISPRHVSTFRKIYQRFRKATTVPERDAWRSRRSETIWRYIFGQVMVVGGSPSVYQLWGRSDLRRTASYCNLCQLSPLEARKTINWVLREAGCRYASSDISKCRKTDAIAHNLNVLQKTKGGPTGFLETLSQLNGPHAERRRVKYVMKVLRYFKSKSSRDFLMEQGLVRNSIALDIRVINVLKKVGIRIPNAVRSDIHIYDRVEADLLTYLCKPLGITGVEFDRLVYQNYKAILNDLRNQ
jgi:hypothetical protein